jgi:hypothetical protein
MAKQKGSKGKKPAAESEQEPNAETGKAKDGKKVTKQEKAKLEAAKALAEVQKALAAAQVELEQEHRARSKAEKTLAEAQKKFAAAQAKVEKEHQARTQAEKALAEAQEALEAAQAKVEEQRQARTQAERSLTDIQDALAAAQVEVEQERDERIKAERALTEATKATAAEVIHAEPLTGAREEDGAEQRVSFVVRLTVDERGQPRRTEVEHAQSGKKEAFPALDVQRLAVFMKACISPPAILEPTAPAPPLPISAEAPTPEAHTRAGLTVSDTQVFRKRLPGVTTLRLSPDESFLVQVRFQLEGSEAPALAAEESPFEIKVLAREVISGPSALLATHSGNLVKNVLEYSTQMQVPGLSPGLYRLVTVVTLHAPVNMVGHHERAAIHVVGSQPSVNPVSPLEVLLSR